MTIDRNKFLAMYGDVLEPDEWMPLYNEAVELDTILRWIELGFPPWGCDACRGAEYGPDGVPCAACGGHSDEMEPPERARLIRAQFDALYAAARQVMHDLLVAEARPNTDANVSLQLHEIISKKLEEGQNVDAKWPLPLKVQLSLDGSVLYEGIVRYTGEPMA